MSISFHNIGHRFGNQQVLRGINLSIGEGEIVCLLGPSGSGKSTLLRLAAGLEHVQAGELRVDGALLAAPGDNPPPESRPVGLVFQDHVLFPHCTVEENVAFGLTHLPAGERQNRVQEALGSVGLGGLGGRYPHTLSGGQQQRVALVRALVREPRVMLLDEPFASVDAPLRHRLREDARLALKRAGSAALMVTHDAEEAMAMADRIAVIREGQIGQLDTPAIIWAEPADPFVAEAVAGAQPLQATFTADGNVVIPFGTFAAADYGLDPGQGLATICVRPEAVHFEPGTGQGIVSDVRFSGARWIVVAEEPASGARLRAFSTSQPDLKAGDSVSVHFAPDGLLVYYRE